MDHLKDIPSAPSCSLPEPAQLAGRARFRALLSEHCIEQESTQDQISWTFAATLPAADIFHFVESEQTCCPSLSFEITLPAQGTRSLKVSGAPGTGAAISRWLSTDGVEPEQPKSPPSSGALLGLSAAGAALGGAVALICCVLPLGAALAAALALPLYFLDGLGAALLALSLVLAGLAIWRRRRSCGPDC